MRAACGVRRRRRRTACTVVRISLGSKPAERTQDADANCGPPLREASARRRLRRRLQAAVLSHGLSGRNLRRGATCGPSPGRSCGPPMSVTSSHAACSTASRRMIHDLSDRSLRRDATVTKRAFAGRSCGPPMACAIAIRTCNRRFSLQPSGGICTSPSAKCSSPPMGGCGLPHICASSLTGQKQSDAAVRRSVRRTAHAVQTAFRVRMG